MKLFASKLLSGLFVALCFGVLGCELETGDFEDTPEGPTPEEIEAAAVAERQANAATPSSQSTTSSPVQGGSEQFLWKPVSESNGRLVILLPASLRGDVTGCSISSPSVGTEQGRFAGDTHNGFRPHYRFSRPGAGYGSSITVRATLSSGGARTWSVPNGAARTTL